MDAREWLAKWADDNINSPGYAEDKAGMQADAVVCAADAQAAGFWIAQLKEAANGDLETYLLQQQERLPGQ